MTPARPEPPSLVFGDLFRAVQLAALFPDCKTFADASPREGRAGVLSAFATIAPRDARELRRFVLDRFDLP